MMRVERFVKALNFILLTTQFSVIILDQGSDKQDVRDDRKTLRFNSDHEFTILQLTDLHYGDSTGRNRMNVDITNKLIDMAKPDMVVITGDAISGYAWDQSTKGFFLKNWKLFTQPFLEKKVLYAYIMGNHDNQADYNYQQIADLEKSHPYSLFAGDSSIDPDSISNYKLEVLSSFENKKHTPSAILWSFDSKDTGCLDVSKSWGCITTNQLDWYTKAGQDMKNTYNQKIDGLAFFHIPTVEFLYLWLFGKTYGFKGESIGCPKRDTGVVRRFIKNDDIKAVFVGHDHDNDFGGNFFGVELVQGHKTGYGSYGPKSSHGGRVIKLKEYLDNKNELKFTYSHHILTHEGEKVYPTDAKWQGYKDPRLACDY